MEETIRELRAITLEQFTELQACKALGRFAEAFGYELRERAYRRNK